MGSTNMSLTVFNDDYTLNIDSFYNNMAVTIKASKAQMQNLGVYKEGWKTKTPFEKVTTNLAMEGNDLVKIPSTPFILYRIEIPSSIANPIGAVSVFFNHGFCGGIHTLDGKRYFSLYTSYAGDFTVYIYSSNKVNTESYGLEVYNPSGVLVFDSENKYLKILSGVNSNKSCAMILQGAVLAQEVPKKWSTAWLDFLWGFIIRPTGLIEEVKAYHAGYYTSRVLNNYSMFPKPIYNNTPIIVDVTNY